MRIQDSIEFRAFGGSVTRGSN